MGSKVWKVGYSGEAGPRVCYGVGQAGQGGRVGPEGEGELWGRGRKWEGEGEWAVKRERLKRGLRGIWFK